MKIKDLEAFLHDLGKPELEVSFYSNQTDGVWLADMTHYFIGGDGLAFMDTPVAEQLLMATGGIVKPIPLDYEAKEQRTGGR